MIEFMDKSSTPLALEEHFLMVWFKSFELISENENAGKEGLKSVASILSRSFEKTAGCCLQTEAKWAFLESAKKNLNGDGRETEENPRSLNTDHSCFGPEASVILLEM